jgi:hypothetical protein
VVPDGDSIYTISGVDGVSGTVDPSFTAGYWVLLAPLAAGEHHVEFSGRTDATPDFRVSATYHLTLD